MVSQFGCEGVAAQRHVRSLGRFRPPLAVVAGAAGNDQVLPGGPAPLGTGDHMVQRQHVVRGLGATVLAEE